MPEQESDALDELLTELAEAYAIATDYWDWNGQHVQVPAETIVAVLAAIDVDAGTPEAARAALEAYRSATWRQLLPAVLVARQGEQPMVSAHLPHEAPLQVWLDTETGQRRDDVRQWEDWTPPREIDGVLTGQVTFALPADLPLGYHVFCARSEDRQATTQVIVTPTWLGLPPSLGERTGWGLATQLYSVRSAQSWGTGDLVDLADLGVWSAVEHRADFVLVNPLHAAEPVPPMEPSPYLPSSRRFANPIYLRPERIPEYAQLDEGARCQIDRLSQQARKTAPADQIDRDVAWAAKRPALQLVYRAGLTPGRRLAFDGYRAQEGRGLLDYATWAALAEEHGSDATEWPPQFRHPDGPAVLEFREQHRDAVDFHCWLQWVLDEQLAWTQQSLRRAGMALGMMADLAVGVHPSGADAWALQETYGTGVFVGSPPDAFNQNGQNWGQPPWRPDQLAQTAYAPFRRLVATVLRNAGGIRVDHIIGLFRLWWIPQGKPPTAGTYVRYDHDAMVGILALEAYRADAVVVGEDLGTVEPWVRVYLRERGILGTSILWFEFDHAGGHPDQPLPAECWREYCLASVTTHDLPPSAGYLAGDHVRLRQRLGLLTRSVEQERKIDRAEQDAWLTELRRVGLLADRVDPERDVRLTVEALHRYLTRTPARLRCVALTDAVGDRRTQNQPGTVDEYPNWRVPLAGPDGSPLALEEIFTSERAATLSELVAVPPQPQPS